MVRGAGNQNPRVGLNQYLTKLADGGLCIAFSGGVDSAVLLKSACDISKNVHAVTLSTLFHPPREPEAAENFAVGTGACFKLLKLDLPDEVMDNPKNRCYLCKKSIFTAISDYARQHGLKYVLDGTNADDLNEYRPGLLALRELDIKSPLAELGISKTQVREIARELGLPVADKPSSPCLATRIPYDTRIDPDILAKIDELESFLNLRGLAVVRARVHGGTVRLEVPGEDFPIVLTLREDISAKTKSLGFDFVSLDLEGFRSGSYDLHFEI